MTAPAGRRRAVAECTLNAMARGRMRAYSAGSHPGGKVNPLVEEFLRAHGVATEGARSKSWDEFTAPGAPVMDFVIIVCDNARSEVCPVWPGRPVTAHWAAEDPALYMDDPAQARRVIGEVHRLMTGRIGALLELPLDRMQAGEVRDALRGIGERG